MNVVVNVENRFDRTPDGAIWTQAQFAYSFWQRYLEVFENVRVVSRVREVPSMPGDWKRADGAGVSVAAVPYYIGPWQYLTKWRKVRTAAKGAVGAGDAVILRVSSELARCIQPLQYRTGHPYGVEVVADPFDAFAPGAVRHPLRPYFRWRFSGSLRGQCKLATAAAYVTEQALQRRYPCPNYSTHYSSVELREEAFAHTARQPRHDQGPLTIVTVASLAQLLKAPEILIDAVAACVRDGLDLRLVLIGDGKHRTELEERAGLLGLGDRVTFLGQLTAGEAVRAELARADLFVLASRHEGLPRATIEAMAQGLPCIGSTVGGIPELLPPEDLVPPGNAPALANKIREIVADRERMACASARNLAKAREYHEDALRVRRVDFYRYVMRKTQEWCLQREDNE